MELKVLHETFETYYKLSKGTLVKDPAQFREPDAPKTLLKKYDVVGVAGNRRRLPMQPAWAFVNNSFTWDSAENLSGAVGHGIGFPSKNVSFYGPSPAPVKLLDGCFLAMNSKNILNHKLNFDEKFTFDFYDMDFCRQIESKNLTMSTSDLSIVHQSGGRFGTPRWQEAYKIYLKKWGS
jgi:hypothetical protein